MEVQKFIIRTQSAGVFFGEIANKEYTPAGLVIDIRNCRRIWYWDGAASLSQLAMDGVQRPQECKFSLTVPSMTVVGAIEILPCTNDAVESINAVPIWTY